MMYALCINIAGLRNGPQKSAAYTVFVDHPPLISRAHSYPRKILPSSAGQFGKFCGLPRQNRPNSVAHRGLPVVSKLSSILLKNFSF